MNDEKFVFVSDIREKKNIGRSARNKRTHNGKRGGVKLPSGYLSKKELIAMSGEVKSYRLNEPMTWEEFKGMPDDIKISYIKLLRSKFNPPETYIAKMLGTSPKPYNDEIHRLGINPGKTRSGRTKWDVDGWNAWCGGGEDVAEIPVQEEIPVAPEVTEPIATSEVEAETVTFEPVEEQPAPMHTAVVPVFGTLEFRGNATDIMHTVAQLLGNAEVSITVCWKEALKEE